MSLSSSTVPLVRAFFRVSAKAGTPRCADIPRSRSIVANRLGGSSQIKGSISRASALLRVAPARQPCPLTQRRTMRNITSTAAASSSPAAVAEEVADAKPVEIFLKDYTPPSYAAKQIELRFELGEETTACTTTQHYSLLGKEGSPLVLNGEEMKLLSVSLNGAPLKESEYSVTKKFFTLHKPPAGDFTLTFVTELQPQNNASLEGLYKSGGNFCTQCEALGFRKITYWQDRPDVMSKYKTTIVGDKAKYPVLLSNGNLIESGDAEGGKHYAVWEDPWPKPSYLFALVAGGLKCIEDSFATKCGRRVTLRIYVEEHNLSKCQFAMKSLKAAMKWDEERFGLEYDLDLFNIVAVDDFNMGIFNSKLILASPETATDADYFQIERVVAHEYFHNWTGNRVTCRDWFQLTLKEGLTVFRDQEFSSDMSIRSVRRIGDVMTVRAAQFPQDAGPMAHPVRPQSYINMNNFYTVTVYEKGAEVVRLYQTLLGRDGFRKGMDLYFKRHDGQAVTCEDFLSAMADANNTSLEDLRPWYRQAGTPTVTVTTSYDAAAKTFTLHCKQELPVTSKQPTVDPMLIPLAVGLLSPQGPDFPLTKISVDGGAPVAVPPQASGAPATTATLRFDKAEQTFMFHDIPAEPVPSMLRNFSAPVRLECAQTTQEHLLFMLANDSDDFNRWEAGQRLVTKLMLSLLATAAKDGPSALTMDDAFVSAMRAVLRNASLQKAFVARCLSLPGEGELAELSRPADPDLIHAVREFVVKSLAVSLKPELLAMVEANRGDPAAPYEFTVEDVGRRALKNAALGYLAHLNDPTINKMALDAFRSATNMTDSMGALAAVCVNDGPDRDAALAAFYEKWKSDPLVVNKWLSLQAMSDTPGNVARVRALMEHPGFDIKNPNKVYSLVGGFTGGSPVNFHALDGSGYEFLTDTVLKIDKFNGQVASRMVSAFTNWKKYDTKRQEMMKAQLQKILDTKGLTDNVFEIVSKSLQS
eukprot:jgi/Mesvir1/10692/Mv13782-RA.1